MTPDIKPLVAGNWKMNGTRDWLSEITTVAGSLDADLRETMDTLICPPATLIYLAAAAVQDTGLTIGAQDCHMAQSGAHTGDISAAMLADAAATHVIVGHSERRTDHGETSDTVKQKAEAVHEQGLIAIVCVGETKQERDEGRTLDVIKDQLAHSVPDNSTSANTVIAYEPVWAIGTGVTPTVSDVEEAHAFMRRLLEDRFAGEGALMKLLYGGSVKPSNASELMAVRNVDGALVGGASLKAADFLAICESYRS
ncbi:triose-phosphate isomerase [Hoeflea prorocentri]|uniref:Triosephosphate isomerase n=1 Tax=Hoeflea prorocentri TaxID=1922333 RepID=A0A9X3ZHB0_9HYPH|nr:triose-phosphate isomerase [Hoeflea prorocentri]MCY6380713.1 triose-phosphate isomerase [Hoeflea prorocentri]MDA5398513.1 triose-phosphate isomerase [Hoeflea prorocentri]